MWLRGSVLQDSSASPGFERPDTFHCTVICWRQAIDCCREWIWRAEFSSLVFQSYLITSLIHCLTVCVTFGSPDVQVRKTMLRHNSDFRWLWLALAVQLSAVKLRRLLKYSRKKLCGVHSGNKCTSIFLSGALVRKFRVGLYSVLNVCNAFGNRMVRRIYLKWTSLFCSQSICPE